MAPAEVSMVGDSGTPGHRAASADRAEPRRRLAGAPEPTMMWQGSGVQIAGDRFGEPGRQLVVLQHGGGQTRHAWRGVGRLLAEAGYDVVSLDARGHGDSQWAPDGNYDREVMVDDLVEVLAQLDAGRPVLVGASMGGNTSLAAIGEGRVDGRALVLVDIAPRIRSSGTRRIGEFMNQRPDGFESLAEVAEAIASYQPHRTRPRNLDGLAKNVRLGEDGRYYWHWDPAFRQRPMLSGEALRQRTRQLEASARNLRVPTLLVRGGLSDVLDEEGAQAFLALVPQAEYVNVADAAHMVAGDRNDVFGQYVVDFLQRVAPAR